MIEQLLRMDSALFNFFNKSLANPVFDLIMPAVTNDWFLRVLMLLILLTLLIFGKKEGRITALLCVLAVIASDQLSSHLIKPLVGRIRPCHIVPDVHLLVGCGGGLAFPSSHAANVFGQAVILGSRHRKAVWLAYPFAVLVSYSRVAVGVHYPGDILGGALVGALAGLVIVCAYKILERWLVSRKSIPGNQS